MTHDPDPTAGDDASRPIPTGPATEWHKVAEPDDLPDGRVRTVTVGRHSLALSGQVPSKVLGRGKIGRASCRERV